MEWISIKDELPPYYKEVIIFNGKEVLYKWHRLSNEEWEYFANVQNYDVISLENITHWMPLIENPKENK